MQSEKPLRYNLDFYPTTEPACVDALPLWIFVTILKRTIVFNIVRSVALGRTGVGSWLHVANSQRSRFLW